MSPPIKISQALAERHALVIHADEIYDQMTCEDAEFVPLATLVHNTVCLTCSGLSKVYRACGYRVGWCVFSGDLDAARSYVDAMELLVAPGSSFNTPYTNYFRITTLPDPDVLQEVFHRINELLEQYT